MKDWKTEVDMRSMPGHFARRVQQLAVALFVQEVGDLALTPVQYSALQMACDQPGLDQKSLAHAISYDTSTIAGVIDRLEARGLVVRTVSPLDRRVRLVNPTEQGIEVIAAVVPRMVRAQERLLEPLTEREGREFMRLMKLIIDANTELSTIPAEQ